MNILCIFLLYHYLLLKIIYYTHLSCTLYIEMHIFSLNNLAIIDYCVKRKKINR